MTEKRIPIEGWGHLDKVVVHGYYEFEHFNIGPAIHVYQDKDDEFPIADIVLDTDINGHLQLLVFLNRDEPDHTIRLDDPETVGRACLKCGTDLRFHQEGCPNDD